jgi:guanylate kinase
MKQPSQAEFKSGLPRAPLLLVLSGPSGVGKDAVLSRLRGASDLLEFIVTITTRRPRAMERDGLEYRFTSVEKFEEMLEHKELLEWANVYGNWYGVPREPVKQALEQGQDVIVKVDVQGAATIKKAVPQAVLIFLMPPEVKELASRLKQRHSESAFDLALRTRIAEEEIKQLSLFDYLVVNRQDAIELAVSDIKAIIRAEQCRVDFRRIVL